MDKYHTAWLERFYSNFQLNESFVQRPAGNKDVIEERPYFLRASASVHTTENCCKCSATELVRVIGRRYGLELLTVIKKKRSIRFNELKTVMGEISSSTLTIRLTELERAGLIERQTHLEVTARAGYSLTKKGRKLLGKSEFSL